MKAGKSLIAKIFVFVIAFFFSACQTTEKSPSISSASIPNLDLSVETIDFKNFIYPYPGPNEAAFTLSDGKKPFGKLEDIAFDFNSVEYMDLTGDKINEAVINLSAHLAVSNKTAIYVYTVENNQPKFLWTFWTGEEAAGGLKKVYSEDGKLIVEVFGKTELENNLWTFSLPKGNAEGICCPDIFTRLRFNWSGEKFVFEGTPELFDYHSKNQKRKG